MYLESATSVCVCAPPCKIDCKIDLVRNRGQFKIMVHKPVEGSEVRLCLREPQTENERVAWALGAKVTP